MEINTYIIIMIVLVLGTFVCFLWALTGHSLGGFSCVVMMFVLGGFNFFTPTEEEMVENEYNNLASKRPECVKDIKDNDFTKISLDCADSYIKFRKDSVFITNLYNKNRAKLLEKLKTNGIVTDTNKTDTTVTIDSTNGGKHE